MVTITPQCAPTRNQIITHTNDFQPMTGLAFHFRQQCPTARLPHTGVVDNADPVTAFQGGGGACYCCWCYRYHHY